ncbi:MAG: hypothetical protein LHV69_11760, partial [Elusimicrobia bacterium]|nr:hypothetical protein [Candidatus Obscuribacterium magneticum]
VLAAGNATLDRTWAGRHNLRSYSNGPTEPRAPDNLRRLARKLKNGIKGKTCPLLAVLNFPYSFGKESTGSCLVSERLTTHLVREGAPLIERRLIQSLLEEKRIWETGITDPGSFNSMGHIMGVEAIVVGSLADSPDQVSTEVRARVVRVDTGEVLSAGTELTERLWWDRPKLPRVAQGRAPVPVSILEGLSATVTSPEESPRQDFTAIEHSPPIFADFPRNKSFPVPGPKTMSKTEMAIDGRKKQLSRSSLVRRLPYHPVAVPVLAPINLMKDQGGAPNQ